MTLVSPMQAVALAHPLSSTSRLRQQRVIRLRHQSQTCDKRMFEHVRSSASRCPIVSMISSVGVKLEGLRKRSIVHCSARQLVQTWRPAACMAAAEEEEEEIRLFLRRVAPEHRVVNIRAVPVAGVKQVYRLKMGNGTSMLFTVGSNPRDKPMRFERHCVSAEACVLAFLYGLPSAKQIDPTRQRCFPNNLEDDSTTDLKSRGLSASAFTATNFLSGVLPLLVKTSLSGRAPSRKQYILTIPTPGKPLDTLERPINPIDAESIYFSIGQLVRRIACHRSPNGRFGEVEDIIERCGTLSSMPLGIGFSTWSVAFEAMMEATLQDLEDRAVHVPYQQIREMLVRLRCLLDAVKRPSLVVMESASASNVLVSKDEAGQAQACGLQHWDGCFFGDPLLASIFFKTCPAAFLTGLATPVSSNDPFESRPIIEDIEHARARLLIYRCYHALLKLGKQYYHSSDWSEEGELEARKELIAVLGVLANVKVTGSV